MKLIDRSKVIKEVARLEFSMPFEYSNAIDRTISHISQLPIIKERPEGKWICFTDDKRDYAKCFNCDYGSEGELYFENITEYCPHCGAKMTGDDMPDYLKQ